MFRKTLVTTALLLASSSAAFAAPSVSASWNGRVNFSIGSNAPSVRDHRTQAPELQAAVDRNYPFRDNYQAIEIRDRSTIECRNWDPTVDVSSRCALYDYGAVEMPYLRGWTNLGARDSSVPGSQFITVERSFNAIRIDALEGRPQITKVQVRFMDGSAQVLAVQPSMVRRGLVIPVRGAAIDQIIVYTAANSYGLYSISAS